MDYETAKKYVYNHSKFMKVKDLSSRISLIYQLDIAGAGGAGSFLKYFSDIVDHPSPPNSALKIAQTFKDVASLLVLTTNSNETSGNTFNSVIDHILLDNEIDPMVANLFYDAFIKLGIKRVPDYNKKEIYTAYINHFLEAAERTTNVHYQDLYKSYGKFCQIEYADIINSME